MSLSCKRSHRSKGGMRVMLFGMLAGLVIGMLLAPRPGVDTLNDLLEGREKLLDKLIRKLPV